MTSGQSKGPDRIYRLGRQTDVWGLTGWEAACQPLTYTHFAYLMTEWENCW